MRKKHLITNLLFRSVDRTRFGAATGRRRRFPFSKSTRRKISEAFNHAFFNKKNLAYRKLTRLYGAGNAAYRFADLCSPTDSRCGSFKDATRLPPKNFGRIKSCSSAHYGLLDLPQAIGCPKDSLQAFLRRSRKGAYVFFLRLPAHIANYLFSHANPAALHARHISATGDSDVPPNTQCPQFSEEKRHKTF